jgi:hypothetical protein
LEHKKKQSLSGKELNRQGSKNVKKKKTLKNLLALPFFAVKLLIFFLAINGLDDLLNWHIISQIISKCNDRDEYVTRSPTGRAGHTLKAFSGRIHRKPPASMTLNRNKYGKRLASLTATEVTHMGQSGWNRERYSRPRVVGIFCLNKDSP